MTDQNSSSESEQYLVALGLVRRQAVREKKCGSTASKADGVACCSFLVFLCIFSFGLICLQDEPAQLREAGINQISPKCCSSDLLLRAAL